MILVPKFILCVLLIHTAFGHKCARRYPKISISLIINIPRRFIFRPYFSKPFRPILHGSHHIPGFHCHSRPIPPPRSKIYGHPILIRIVGFRPYPSTIPPPRSTTSDPVSTVPTTPVSTIPPPTETSSPASSPAAFDPTTHPNWKLINDEKCGVSSENRIVGGINATLGQYPWIARIGYRDDKNATNFRCGGTLISSTHVLTAGHCIINLPGYLKVTQVRLGDYNTEKDVDCVEDECAAPHKDFDVIQLLVHKHYGQPKNANDIALIKLNQTVQFTQWISPICLPFGSLLQKNLSGSKVDIAGWGFHDVTKPIESVILQTVKLPVLNTNICIRKFRRFVIDDALQMCVGGDVGKDSCNGDSGGPLMKVEVEGNDGPKYYLFGIVSFGATYCGLTTNPAIYTKVVHYMKWILDNLNV